MLKNIRLIIIFIIALISLPNASAAQSHDSTVVFRFMSKNDVFWASYKDNESEFDRLASFIQHNRSAIMRGKYPVKVNGYCYSFESQLENYKTAKIRSNRVKSYMITVHGLKEENFKTTNFTTSYDGDKDVVLVIFKLAKKDIVKETQPTPKFNTTNTVQAPIAKEVKPVQKLTITDTIYICSICSVCVDAKDLTKYSTKGETIVFVNNHPNKTLEPPIKKIAPERTEGKNDITDNTATFSFDTPTNYKYNTSVDKHQTKRIKKEKRTSVKQLKYYGKTPEIKATKVKPAKKIKIDKVKPIKIAKTPKIKATTFKNLKTIKVPKVKIAKIQTYKASNSVKAKPSYQLKINLLYLLATVHNLEFETLFADRRVSINLEGQYSHTNWDKNTQRLRLGSASPELRYYPIKDKLFIGAYYCYTDFNIKFGSTGQQGISQGAGITIGTKLPIGKHFGFEFALSAGFNSNIFDKYTLEYGTANYAGSYNIKYFGPTKAKISFFWKFGAEKNK